MPHAKSRPTISDLQSWGYSEQPDGTWAKSNRLDAVSKPVSQSNSRSPTQGPNKNEKGSKAKVERKPIVCIYGFRCRLLDDDNFRGGLKHLRDSIAQSLNRDDFESEIEWRYQQVKVSQRKEEGTLIKIFQ